MLPSASDAFTLMTMVAGARKLLPDGGFTKLTTGNWLVSALMRSEDVESFKPKISKQGVLPEKLVKLPFRYSSLYNNTSYPLLTVNEEIALSDMPIASRSAAV